MCYWCLTSRRQTKSISCLRSFQSCSGSSSAERAFSGGCWLTFLLLSCRSNHRVINLERNSASRLLRENLLCQNPHLRLSPTGWLAVQSGVLQPRGLCLLRRSVTCFSGEPQSSTLFAEHFILDISCFAGCRGDSPQSLEFGVDYILSNSRLLGQRSQTGHILHEMVLFYKVSE